MKINTATAKYKIFVHYAAILIITFLVSLVLSPALWIRNVYVVHTILELVCIFIAISTFLLVWNTYEKTLNSNHFIGFGFLAVAVFDAFHTYYFFGARILSQGYPDLPTRYWIIGRVVEASILSMVALKVNKFLLNKWIGLIFTVIFSFGISILVIFFPNILPVMMTDQGVTTIKIILEYVVVLIIIISLFNLRGNLEEKSIVSYRHIFIALLVMIPAELIFAAFKEITSFYSTYGHILRIVYYYYLYKAVFVSAVTYPYNRLEIERKHAAHLSDTLGDLLDTLPIAIHQYSIDGRLQYVSKKFEELLVCDRNCLLGLKPEEVRNIFTDGREKEKTVYDRAFEDGMIHEIGTYKTFTGDHIKLSVNAYRIKNGILIMFNDVRKEQELENLQLQTQTVLNAIEKMVLIIDKNNKILMCNKAYEELIGVSAEEIVGADFNEHRSVLQTYIEKEYEKDNDKHAKYKDIEISITTMHGKRKQLLYNSSQIHNVDGEIIGEIAVASDITDLKDQQEKMMQQEKLALLGQLGAGIVHETRNYLTTIKGNCQLIDMNAEDEKIKKYAFKINKDIDEINRIISEFLSLSKLRDTELLEVSMYDILQSLKEIVETSSLIRGIDVELQISKEERYLLCGESQIKQVILNICKNAVDAMDGIESAKLKIEAGFSEPNNEMFIRITDNGQGMSEETLSRIGTPFFTTKNSGTGLGLNVCYNIIKQHQGKIEAESELGRGTTFTIVLPCIRDDDLEDIV